MRAAISEPKSAAELRALYAKTRQYFGRISAPPVSKPAKPAAPVILPIANLIMEDEYVHLLAAWTPKGPGVTRLRSGSEVASALAHHFGFKRDDLVGDVRMARVVRVRQAAMYVCVNGLGFNLSKTGRVFGGRDHNTVHYSVERAALRMKDEPEYADTISIYMGLCR